MPDTRKIEASGMFYRKSGSGPAIMLLHGFPGSGKLWRNIWADLSVTNTVLVPDMPGSGNSRLDKETGIDDMAMMINGILEQEQISKVVIAGHSMGGYIGMAFASLYPHKLAGISLVHSTTAADDEEKIKTRQKSIELIQKGGKSQFISQMIPNLFSPVTKQSDPALIRQQMEHGMEMSDEGMINFYAAMIKRKDTTDILDSARFPVQWICGLDDNVIPYKKILGKTHKSDVNFVSFYNNCGHMSMLEAPVNLISDLEEFSAYCYNREY